jgi:hypothetical protein
LIPTHSWQCQTWTRNPKRKIQVGEIGCLRFDSNTFLAVSKMDLISREKYTRAEIRCLGFDSNTFLAVSNMD